MGYWINGGMLGLIFILAVSMALTPVLCNTLKEKYSVVSCKLEDNLTTFSHMYLQSYFILLLIAGFIAGGLIGRLVYLIKKNEVEKTEIVLDKIKGKPQFKWMWEH